MAENPTHDVDHRAGRTAATSNKTSTPATRVTEAQCPFAPGTPSYYSWIQGFRAPLYTAVP